MEVMELIAVGYVLIAIIILIFGMIVIFNLNE